MTTQSNRVASPGYTPAPLFSRRRRIRIKEISSAVAQTRAVAARRAAETAKNALFYEKERRRRQHISQLKKTEEATFYNKIYFQRLHELLGS